MVEIGINFVEMGICWYLFSHVLEGTGKYRYLQFIGVIIQALAITALDGLHLQSSVRLACITSMQIIFAYTCFCGSRMGRVICGCSYMLVALTSEHIVFRITDLLLQSSLKLLLEPGTDRYYMVLLYLLISFIVASCLIRLLRNRGVLPVKVQIILLAVILCTLGLLDKFADASIAISSLEAYDDISFMTDIVCILLIIITIAMMGIMVWFAKECQEKNNLLAKQRNDEYRIKELESVQDTIVVLRNWRHDVKGHIQTVIGLLESDHVGQALNYIREISGDMDHSGFMVHSGNLILDAILSSKYAQANRHGIRTDYFIKRCENFPLPDADISSLFGNLLENAIEANLHVENKEKRYIKVILEPGEEQLKIIVENTCDGVYNWAGDVLKTRKGGTDHGIGLSQIARIVEQTGGFCKLYPEKEQFKVVIIIPLHL